MLSHFYNVTQYMLFVTEKVCSLYMNIYIFYIYWQGKVYTTIISCV